MQCQTFFPRRSTTWLSFSLFFFMPFFRLLKTSFAPNCISRRDPLPSPQIISSPLRTLFSRFPPAPPHFTAAVRLIVAARFTWMNVWAASSPPYVYLRIPFLFPFYSEHFFLSGTYPKARSCFLSSLSFLWENPFLWLRSFSFLTHIQGHFFVFFPFDEFPFSYMVFHL